MSDNLIHIQQELSRLLARSDVDPNKLNSLGEGPLHTLAKRDLKESKKLHLLYTFLVGTKEGSDEDGSHSAYSIDVNLTDSSGNTALHLAAVVGCKSGPKLGLLRSLVTRDQSSHSTKSLHATQIAEHLGG